MHFINKLSDLDARGCQKRSNSQSSIDVPCFELCNGSARQHDLRHELHCFVLRCQLLQSDKGLLLLHLMTALLPHLQVVEAYVSCSEEEQDAVLYYILAQHPGRTLVFVNAISTVRRLAALLRLLQLPALALHASMQQRQRLKALDRFKGDPHAVMIATDVAARGLDIQVRDMPAESLHVQHCVDPQSGLWLDVRDPQLRAPGVCTTDGSHHQDGCQGHPDICVGRGRVCGSPTRLPGGWTSSHVSLPSSGEVFGGGDALDGEWSCGCAAAGELSIQVRGMPAFLTIEDVNMAAERPWPPPWGHAVSIERASRGLDTQVSMVLYPPSPS